MLYINLNYIDHFTNFLFQKYRWRNSGKNDKKYYKLDFNW